MWQKLSLRARLNTILALVLMLGLAINIARLLLEAGPRVQAEDQSVIRLARGFVETLVAGLNESPDPEARLNRIIDLGRHRDANPDRVSDRCSPSPHHDEGGQPSAGADRGADRCDERDRTWRLRHACKTGRTA
jgi:two-component system sensor histidine kinase UhpB